MQSEAVQSLCILGSTGSIGQSTLDVIALHPQQYRVYALTAHKKLRKLVEQVRLYKPRYAVVADEGDYLEAKTMLAETGVEVELLAGAQALVDVASSPEVDTVMAAIVGAAGLLPTLAAVKAGKKILLANKESLVMSGDLFMTAVRESKAQLLPIDSEHNAIFQCLPTDFRYGQLAHSGISKILLTGSGGPFLTSHMSELASMTPDQACAHPNWDMGRKISVDSATMMNKGLELIEACWLFGLKSDEVQVVLHPQSIIHSMVQYLDGSVLAQLGNPDMRTPIAHGLAYPRRIDSGVKALDFSQLMDFSFCLPDYSRYPNLRLAMQACEAGQYASTALNAANEVAVEAFLQGKITFTEIAVVNEKVLLQLESQQLHSIDAVLDLDASVRRLADKLVMKVA